MQGDENRVGERLPDMRTAALHWSNLSGLYALSIQQLCIQHSQFTYGRSCDLQEEKYAAAGKQRMDSHMARLSGTIDEEPGQASVLTS